MASTSAVQIDHRPRLAPPRRCQTHWIALVALIDDEEATLSASGASIALEPTNSAYEVRILPPNRVRVQGKLVGLFRKY